jgi:hypothetical protein
MPASWFSPERQRQRLERRRQRSDIRSKKAVERADRSAGECVEAGLRGWGALLVIFVIAASIGFGISAPGDLRSRLGVGMTAAALSAGAIAVGSFVGLLFGLPRHVDNTTGATKNAHFLLNTNLMKVSDWLTTILIGLGLVQLNKVGPAIVSFSSGLEEPLGGEAYAGAYGVSTMISLALAAMMMMFLWSIRLRELFEKSDWAAEEAKKQAVARHAKQQAAESANAREAETAHTVVHHLDETLAPRTPIAAAPNGGR